MWHTNFLHLVHLFVDRYVVVDPLVMVVHSHCQSFFGRFLTNDVVVEVLVDLLRVRRWLPPCMLTWLTLRERPKVIMMQKSNEEITCSACFTSFTLTLWSASESTTKKWEQASHLTNLSQFKLYKTYDKTSSSPPCTGNEGGHMFARSPTLGTQELVSSLAATTSTAGRSLNQVLKIVFGLNNCNKIALLK